LSKKIKRLSGGKLGKGPTVWKKLSSGFHVLQKPLFCYFMNFKNLPPLNSGRNFGDQVFLGSQAISPSYSEVSPHL